MKNLHREFCLTCKALQLLHGLCALHNKQVYLDKPHKSAVIYRSLFSNETIIAERFKQWILSHKNFSSLEPTLNIFIRDYASATFFLKELLQIQLLELREKLKFSSEANNFRLL